MLFEEHRRDTAAEQIEPTGSNAHDARRAGTNVRMNDPQCVANSTPCLAFGGRGRSETTVAAAENGHEIVSAWNNAEGLLRPPFGTLPGPPGVTAFGFSSDGGLTWTDGGPPPAFVGGGDTIISAGDPWLDRGGADESTFYFANLAISSVDDSPRDPTMEAFESRGVSVHRGHFHGDGFAWEDGHLITPPHAGDLYDKDAIATAKDGSGLGIVTISNFLTLCGKPAFGFGQVEVWRTVDGGNAWVGPAVAGPDLTFNTANPADPNCGNGGVLQQSSNPAIGPGGQVYVVWQRGPTLTTGAASPHTDIVVAHSGDGGATFEAPVNVSTINSMRQNPPVGFNKTRINDHPRIAVATSGPHGGRVYVSFTSAVREVPPQGPPLFANCPKDAVRTRFLLCVPQSVISSQVFVSHSDDQGHTWSAPTPVAAPVPDTGLKRWWPVVSVESNGDLDVLYYESQERSIGTTCNVQMPPLLPPPFDIFREIGPAVSLVDVFSARSIDGGSSFEPATRITSATSNWCATRSDISANFGDYIGATTAGGHALLSTWTDGRSGLPDAFFANTRVGQDRT